MIRATPTNIEQRNHLAAVNAEPAANTGGTGSGRFKAAADFVLQFCSSLDSSHCK